MQAGTVVLLERMKDNPQEFFGAGSHRWDRIITDAMPYLPEEDKAAIESALSVLHINRFNERVFKHLAGEDASLFGPSAFGSVPQDPYPQEPYQQNSGWGPILPAQKQRLQAR